MAMNKELKKTLAIEAKKELARRSFWHYTLLKAPSFYKPDRDYLHTLCSTLQSFITSKKKVLIVNLPPRHGKSRTLQLFVEWLLGGNNQLKIMTGSYNETLSTMFSKNVRNSIQEEKADLDAIVYNDIFPTTRIKQGDASMNLWSLEGGYNNYLATSPTGTATGFGADILILDDTIKNAEEAYNESVKSKHWEWFTNTMLSRLEEGGKIIIVMTRWASDDLAGRALSHFDDFKVEHINMKAVQADGSMLCPQVLSNESNEEKKKAMGFDIWSANYQQEPIDIKGRLYSGFKTYTQTPEFTKIANYTDTADTGSDYLCSITYGIYQKEAYILDVVFTKESMEKTEPMTAKTLYINRVQVADIEGNNGGRGFARSVERILKERHNSNYTKINTFHQSKNKIARILGNSTWCMNHIYFPCNWKDKWPEFYEALMKYQKEGKNAHDDAPDALSGICDKMATKELFSFN